MLHAVEKLEGALDVELQEDGLHVGFDGVEGDFEFSSDLLVSQATDARSNHFSFTRTELQGTAVHRFAVGIAENGASDSYPFGLPQMGIYAGRPAGRILRGCMKLLPRPW